ncbi:hibch [Symbiodinium sp. CCMP2592]|nr:hibch [Symbiodinium sp. CCMP2592]
MAAEVLTQFSPDCGACEITLNRPDKLNALNLNMIRRLHEAVDKVDAKLGKVGCLIMDGAGGKAFCAGGDVQMIREEGLAGGSLPADFFFEEYGIVFRLATLLERTGCVQVSLFDGITMGGGVGLSTHGPFRIVTEKTRFAMPEMAIGLFPDVGATQILSRLKAGPAVGLFLGITGTNISAWDCLEAGVATHYVPSARLPELREKLLSRFRPGLVGAAAMKLCEEIIAETSSRSSARSENPVLSAENLSVINRCFNAPTVEEIVVRLRAETCGFAAETLQKMFRSCSPTSCKVTLQAMQDLQRTPRSIGEVLQIEYRLSQRFTTRPQPLSDFFEGIRAVLVDKDRKQKWTPSWDSLDEVTEAKVSEFFSPLDAGHSRGELHLEDIFAFSESRRSAFPEVHLKSKL